MTAKFGKEDLTAIHVALMEGFDIDEMDILMSQQWGIPMAREINVNDGYRKVFWDLILWASKEGRAADLLALAYSARPRNEVIRDTARRLLGDADQEAARYTLPQPPSNLEAKVNSRLRVLKFELFMERMKALGRAICRVSTPQKYGTGFLVAPQTVLTNYHVVEDIFRSPAAASEIRCDFDFHGNGMVEETYELADGKDWCRAHSVYSDSDRYGQGDPESDKLDYALLTLKEPAGSDRRPLSLPGRIKTGEKRRKATIIKPRDIVMIPQHIAGQPLEIAFGSMVEFPASGLRQRYDVTTDHGSSGSPVLTIDLELIGLHHAAEPSSEPAYNQSIPIWLVADDLDRRKVKVF